MHAVLLLLVVSNDAIIVVVVVGSICSAVSNSRFVPVGIVPGNILAARLQTGKSQSTHIVLMDLAMNVGGEGGIKANSSTELTYDGYKGKEVFACRTEGNVLCFHGRKGNLSLQMRAPKDRSTKSQDDIASATAGAMGVQRVLMAIEPSKVSFRVAIHMRLS